MVSQRIPGLDGLRAIAILSVIVCHVNSEFSARLPSGHINHWISAISSAGWMGVDLFFVLSGFLITGILYRAKGSENFYRNFYIRRALRIFPLFYVYTAAVMILPLTLGGVKDGALAFWAHAHVLDRASVLAYFYNFRVAPLGHHLPLVNHFWSLAVEEHFYFVWPWMVLYCRRKTLMRVCLVGCCVSFLLRLILMDSPRGLFAAYVLTPCRLDGLLLGSWLALASLDDALWNNVRRFAPAVAVIAMTGVVAIAVNRGHFYDIIPPGTPHDSRPVVTAGITLGSVLFAATLAIVVSGGRLMQWLQSPILQRIGLYSYGMYVYHMCIILLLRQVNFFHGISEAHSKVFLSIAVTATTFVVAAISYHGLERPFLKRKSHYEPRGPKVQTAGAPAGWQSAADLLRLNRQVGRPQASLTSQEAPHDKSVR